MLKPFGLALVLVAAALPARSQTFGVDVQGLAAQAHAVAAEDAPPYEHAPPLPPISPERLGDLIRDSSQWPARKADAKAALDALVEYEVQGGDESGWRTFAARAWSIAQSVEAEQDILADRVAARISAETTDPELREGRLGAAATLADFRKLTVYGNIVPRIIDEAHKDAQGVYDGRAHAGPSWALVMTWEESQAVNRAIIVQTGISPDDYASMGAAVSKEYQAAHP